MGTATANIDFRSINNPAARPGFHYILPYIGLFQEISETTGTRINMDRREQIFANLNPVQGRAYFLYYRRLFAYGGFAWDTRTFDTSLMP